MGLLLRRRDSLGFKRDAAELVTEQKYSLVEMARGQGIHANLIRRWNKIFT